MKKTIALLLAVVMCLSVFAACGKTNTTDNAQTETNNTEATTPADTTGNEGTTEPDTTPDAQPEEKPVASDPNRPLVIGYSSFSSKFSPFFAESAYDQDAAAMTQLGLLTSDRTGAMILNGIEGETIAYNGTDYTYNGPADCVITENADGTVYYDFTLADGLKFSDGEDLTIDDVIFSMYVLCDPTYDGASTLYAQPILGMKEYRSGMDTRANVILAAGPDGYTETDLYTEEQYNAFWNYYNTQAGIDFAQEIVDYVIANYGAAYGVSDVTGAAGLWGFELEDGADAEAFWNAIVEAYEGDIDTAVATETAGSDLVSLTIAALGEEYVAGVQTGESAANIAGIQKTGENSLRVILTELDATAIYQLSLSITPLHYYGDKASYDYDNNCFGFAKGDLSSVRAKTTQPLGAGPYKFVKFENGVVYYEANEYYFKGCPLTKYVQFQECTADEDKLNGVITGNIDISDPSFSNDSIAAIEKANGGELNGSVVTVNTVDNLGYGYIGISASRVNVGEKDSDASKNLRKAIATVISVYRNLGVESYYGDRAAIINYPISNTSWAAPQSTDDGYKVAFSVDVNGNDIYTSAMGAEEKYAAALEAALGYFEAAGYTVENGKVTAAPEGAKLEYECWIPADGIGDHPSFMVITEAAAALESIGFKLVVKDLSNSADLWDGLDADTVDMWCAAWGATVDPDMYQIYHSTNVVGLPGSTGSNHYNIQDEELDEIILAARASTDQAYRKLMYKAALDIVIDWAVEIPVYQRQNAIIFSSERVNLSTITPDITTFYGWMSEIENTVMQ
ncbi:MAG: ABC transporter substrate-binding protein [Oscillospiraceae bacterium]|nr:ABC transporter substrate-binding protein [Oscillospiraceae bacterium]